MHALTTVERIHDRLTEVWESKPVEAVLAWSLVVLFLGGLAGIWLKRWGFLPPELAAMTPDSMFEAVNLAFTALLVYEILALILVLARSVSISLGKQFEILSLILIRQSFKGLSAFGYPFTLEGHLLPLAELISNGVGALLIFVLLGVFYRLQRHKCVIRDDARRRRFIALKKLISLLMLVAFVVAGLATLFQELNGGPTGYSFFARFYTILIFTDILVVLVALRYQPGFPSLFRNSGYTLATLFIRLSLVAAPFYNAALGVFAVGYAIGLTLAYNAYLRREGDDCIPVSESRD